MFYIKLFVLTLIAFFALDMLWLGTFAKAMYLEQYGAWLRLERGQLLPVWWATLLVYALFSLGILLFVLPLAHGRILQALLYGAAMGFIIYGIYDFTCLAIFKDWPVCMAFIDWAWGTFLCAMVAIVAVYLTPFCE